ncbi:MAG: HNH endonuclease [Candidatus Eisenbacteria bacterium]|uniref:HNH endonuclease n=1 Tax=Eiseniibacteriota bacterium TaxID=2212470 RepID=A0A956M3V5_UNCEI|nr:HNH endonuclease [Candidatus Eisenbacteria bacterium]
MALLFGQLEDFDALLAEAPSKYDPQTPASLIDRIEEIRVVAAPIRALSLRLLLHLETLGAATVLGLRTAESLAGEALRLSPRTHRAMLAEARQLRRRPELEQTFLTGRMGTSKLRLLQGIERERLGPFLERAGRITVRQLKRELALREKLGALRRTLSRELLPGRVEDPLPQGGLEERLLCILLQHGWTIESLEERVTRSANLYTGSELRTLLQRADRLRRGDLHLENPHLQDPAADHALMHRLEVLVDLALLCACPDSLLVGHQVHPRGRQTLDPDMELCRISFWAPREIAQDLDLFLDLVHRRIGPMPTWAAVMILVRDATETWMRVDPAQKPRWWRVYERDRYRCRVPGCTRRSNLHAHHAEFRSRGGVDALWNLVSVCYRHHQDGIHAGHIDAAGDANRGLRWILGPRARRGRAFRVYRGDLRIA